MLQDLFPASGTFSIRQTRASAESCGQTHSHFSDFRTNPVFKSARQAKLQGCFPTPTSNAQRELLGNTSPIYTFSETAWNTARAGFHTACRSKSSSQGHQNCPSAQRVGQTHSQPDQACEVLCCKLNCDDYFDAVTTWTANNFGERFMQSCVLAESPIV